MSSLWCVLLILAGVAAHAQGEQTEESEHWLNRVKAIESKPIAEHWQNPCGQI
jgi:hypothetical protein